MSNFLTKAIYFKNILTIFIHSTLSNRNDNFTWKIGLIISHLYILSRYIQNNLFKVNKSKQPNVIVSPIHDLNKIKLKVLIIFDLNFVPFSGEW